MQSALELKKQEACHDALFSAVQDLEEALGRKEVPPAGTTEQRTVREALAGCGLPDDHELVQKARRFLKDWETKHFAIRAEVRLLNAQQRCAKGFKMEEPEAGPMLASAIAEVAEKGVDENLMESSKRTLVVWREKQAKVCSENLKLAIDTKAEEFLRQAIKIAERAGVPQAEIDYANQQLMRLQLSEEVNAALENAMEAADNDLLEEAIQKAHDGMFVEEESPALQSAVLQVHNRIWVYEFDRVLRERKMNGMDSFVKAAQDSLATSQAALTSKEFQEDSIKEVIPRKLGASARSLSLMLPKVTEFMTVKRVEEEMRRVLLAVEKNAADLPGVLAEAQKWRNGGVDKDLINECQGHLKNYEATLQDLKTATSQPSADTQQLKTALIKARLAGADLGLIESGFGILQQRDPNLYAYAQTELELRIALTEADDIDELDVEGRFLRLQDAAGKANQLRPPLPKELMKEVEDINVALAAEQSLKFAIRDAENALADRVPTEHLQSYADTLKQAALGASNSALDSVKEAMLPTAEKLQDMLEGEVESRMETKAKMSSINLQLPVAELTTALSDAREAFVQENLLTGIYTELRKRKLEFIAKDWRAARTAGNHQLALAYWHRGVALDAGKERSGEDWLQDHLPDLESKWSGGITVSGEFKQNGGGSFGSQTWRQNPYFFIRVLHDEDTEDPVLRAQTPGGPVQVTIYAVEEGVKTHTLTLHAVRNKKQVAFAGCGTTLMPGFQVLAASTREQDVPRISFQVDVQSEELQPVFVVPSVAIGEQGGFKLLVEASRPVEVVEVGPAERLSWELVASHEVQWGAAQPHNIIQGGGRPSQGAPSLSWYRNPQFVIRYDREDSMDAGSLQQLSRDSTDPLAGGSLSMENLQDSLTTPEALLFALLVPSDRRFVHPAAIHLLRNKAMEEEDSSARQEGLVQNPWYHEVLASSCTDAEYSTDSELGAVCAVPLSSGEQIIVVPSLESREAEASYKILFYSTTRVSVKRIR
jgi:urease gamma subunit